MKSSWQLCLALQMAMCVCLKGDNCYSSNCRCLQFILDRFISFVVIVKFQLRRGIDDNSKIIFLFLNEKHIL